MPDDHRQASRFAAMLLRLRSSDHPLAISRRRLILINMGVVAAIIVMMALAIYGTDRYAVDQQIDQQLIKWSQRDEVQEFYSSQAISEPEAYDPSDQYEPTTSNIFTLFYDVHGNLLADPGFTGKLGLSDQPAVIAVLGGKNTPILQTIAVAGHHIRIYSRVVRTTDGRLLGAMQVGISYDARDRQLGDLLAALGIVGVGMLVLAGLASLWLANLALAPTRLAFERQRQFAAAASHELRTPLALVRSQAELLTRRLQRHPDTTVNELAADADEIVAETDFMARLVHDLLLLARDPADVHLLRRQMVSFDQLTDEVVSKMAAIAAAKAIVLTATIPQSLTPAAQVNGDADRLRQLLVIVLDNALNYTPEHGGVTLNLRTEASAPLLGITSGHVILAVTDTGPGIAHQDQEHIFEPFFRVNHAHTSAAGHHGMGLGLSLARWIVSAHGGTIEVHSQPGKGSTFIVKLPLA